MNIEQALLKNFRELPPEKQQEILDFSEFIRQKTLVKPEPKIPKQKAENWKNWAESQPKNSPGLPESALKRETIY
ncbi:DUF2281 domain-containing protein [Okeania sp. SIO2B3]|uniref:DUF2281 domain-containing protein n=1 Tax=Okeania sp. SIO2B3 TaxID=2607784 RepID=UPI0013BF95C0|nr:DUF2281 domain-containing protein [Okeania sp. SIO2B3]NET46278.1 DUF2281 domain-containing protein [Okeania sp. SIO2B3]